MPEKFRAHIFISGRVQGVFFRYSLKKKAKGLGVFGWTRNLSDGRLEAVLEGDRENVYKLLGWAKRGPILAKVENMQIVSEEFKNEFGNFEIRN